MSIGKTETTYKEAHSIIQTQVVISPGQTEKLETLHIS